MSNHSIGHKFSKSENPKHISGQNKDKIINGRIDKHRNKTEIKKHLKDVIKSKPSFDENKNIVAQVIPVETKLAVHNSRKESPIPKSLFPSDEMMKELDMAYEGAMDLLMILDEDGVNRRKDRSKFNKKAPRASSKAEMQKEVDMAYEGAMQLLANERSTNKSHVASSDKTHRTSHGGAKVGGRTRHTSAVPSTPADPNKRPLSNTNSIAPKTANALPSMPHRISHGGAKVGGGTRHTSAVPSTPADPNKRPLSKTNSIAPKTANALPSMPHRTSHGGFKAGDGIRLTSAILYMPPDLDMRPPSNTNSMAPKTTNALTSMPHPRRGA